MTIRRDHMPRDLVTPARQTPNHSPDEYMHIVRIRSQCKLSGAPVGLAEGDLTQLGNNPFAENESNAFGSLREMAVRRGGRAEKGGVQQSTRRSACDSRASGQKDNDCCHSEQTAPIEG